MAAKAGEDDKFYDTEDLYMNAIEEKTRSRRGLTNRVSVDILPGKRE